MGAKNHGVSPSCDQNVGYGVLNLYFQFVIIRSLSMLNITGTPCRNMTMSLLNA